MTKSNEPTYITVGRIGSSFGVHGWLKINTYTEYGPQILAYAPWYISRDKQHWEIITVEDGKQQGDTILAKIKGIHSPEEARLLTGAFIAIQRSQLPELEEDEYYWSDLIGLSVIDQHHTMLGKVIYLMETGSNDVLIVKGEREYAIPYLPGTTIKQVNLQNKEIHIDWEII